MNRRELLHAALPRLLAMAFITAATTAWAVTTIEMTPVTPDPPILGREYHLAVKSSDMIAKSEWKLERKFGKCAVPPFIISEDVHVTEDGSLPGIYKYSAINTYEDGGFGDPVPSPTLREKTVTIAPADNFVPMYGPKILRLNSSSIKTTLDVYSGENYCGSKMIGMVQQRITNQVGPYGMTIPDGTWEPNAPSATLYLTGSEITDEVAASVSAQVFEELPEGAVLYSATQEFRIVYSTPCGESYTMPLGGWTITKRRRPPRNGGMKGFRNKL